jgi:TonB-linked SusC/RagA family outer membrane protein
MNDKPYLKIRHELPGIAGRAIWLTALWFLGIMLAGMSPLHGNGNPPLDRGAEAPELSALQQGVVVTGSVVDMNSREALPGVTIQIKGTLEGTVTDIDGRYRIRVAGPESILVFSFVGYQRQEITVGGQTTINVELPLSLAALDEVVVTALGISRSRRALGYSVGEVSSDDLLSSLEGNVVSALSGKIPGVQIKTASSQAGSAARIVVRGHSSLLYDNQPLFVVDGIPFANNEVAAIDYGPGSSTGLDIDPANIESITVLKGAAASALYGSRAANGVVIITTKSGKFNLEPRVRISHRSNFDRIYESPLSTSWSAGNYNPTLGKYEYFDVDVRPTASSFGPRISEVEAAGLGKRYDRWSYFDTGYTSESSFDITGGGERVNYFGAINRTAQQGVLDPIKLDRTSFTTNFEVQVTNRLKSTIGFNYTRTLNDRLVEGWDSRTSFMNSFLAAPWTWNPEPIFDANGKHRIFRGSGRNNFLWVQDYTLNSYERNRFLPNIGLEFKILEGLKISSRTGFDYYHQRQQRYVDLGSIAFGSTTGTFNQSNTEFVHFNSDIFLTYETAFLDGDLRTDFMVGQNIQANRQLSEGIDGSDYQILGWYNIANAQTRSPWSSIYQQRSVSAFGQAVVSFRDFLYYTFTGRNDWSSTLPAHNNSYFYSSSSLGFVFTELFDAGVLDFGKINASYANVGNDAGAYLIHTRFFTANAAGGAGVPAMRFPYQGIGSFLQGTAAGNPDLRAESTTEIELGFELRAFKNRLGIEAAVYRRVGKDQILPANLPLSSGYTTALLNIGQITNKGIEVVLTGRPVETSKFKWDAAFNIYANRSNVDKIADGVPSINLGANTSIVVGEPYAVFRGSAYMRDENGNRIVVDQPGNPRHGYYHIDYGQNIIGTNEADYAGGLRNTFIYGNFALSAFVDFRVGGHVSNGTDYYLMYYGLAAKQEDRPDNNILVHEGMKGHLNANNQMVITGVNDIPSEYQRGWQFYYSYVTEEAIQPADFIKLREVSLGYTVPSRVVDNIRWLDNVSLNFTGRNLWRKFHKDFSGADPEANQLGASNAQGWFTYEMPATRTYSFGVTLNLR